MSFVIADSVLTQEKWENAEEWVRVGDRVLEGLGVQGANSWEAGLARGEER